jgi:hypothetical protein
VRAISSTADLVRWLLEVGVPEADRDTPISSLNLTWLLHRYEETVGCDAPFSPHQLTGARTVGALADLLDSVAPGAES